MISLAVYFPSILFLARNMFMIQFDSRFKTHSNKFYTLSKVFDEFSKTQSILTLFTRLNFDFARKE